MNGSLLNKISLKAQILLWGTVVLFAGFWLNRSLNAIEYEMIAFIEIFFRYPAGILYLEIILLIECIIIRCTMSKAERSYVDPATNEIKECSFASLYGPVAIIAVPIFLCLPIILIVPVGLIRQFIPGVIR